MIGMVITEDREDPDEILHARCDDATGPAVCGMSGTHMTMIPLKAWGGDDRYWCRTCSEWLKRAGAYGGKVQGKKNIVHASRGGKVRRKRRSRL